MATTNNNSISMAARYLSSADAVLVVAGAGMSVGPTIDNYGRTFVDNEAFRRFYPEMTFARTSWEASFSPAKPSGWWIDHTHHMTGGSQPSPAYHDLLKLVHEKDYFVLTSNVDGLFSRAGFDPSRIYTAQGDFRVRQCSLPCSNAATWLCRPDVEKILPQINRRTMELQGSVPDSWTACQRCGMVAQRPNLRGGKFFVHTPYQPQQDELVKFVEKVISDRKRLVVLEIGCGFNTPVVTRMPAESIAREVGAPFIRVNLKDCDVPETSTSVCLQMDTTRALQGLLAAFESVDAHPTWPLPNTRDGGSWRKILQQLQDPARPDKYPALQSWTGGGLTARAISIDGTFEEQ